MVQRIRVRWDADGRGAVQANRRSGLPDAFVLPDPLVGDVLMHDVMMRDGNAHGGKAHGGKAHDGKAHDIVVHDVLMDSAEDYRPAPSVGYGQPAARKAGLWLELRDGKLVVDQLPGRHAYPRPRASQRLFTLGSGQIGRVRANFRFTGVCCARHWHYEQWTVHVVHVALHKHPHGSIFLTGQRDRDLDHRVHLYGGRG